MKHPSFKAILLAMLMYSSVASLAQTPTKRFHITDPGVTVKQVFDSLQVQTMRTGAKNKKAKTGLRYNFWTARAGRNDSSGTDMFTQYFQSVDADIKARYAGTCASGGFQGAWQCIGPDTLDKQAMGYVECLWADPGNANVLLAGTYGGIFKTTDQGKSWKCITDNAPVPNGVTYVSSIAVSPSNTNKILFGTSSEFLVNLQVQAQGGPIYGSSMYQSNDGGVTWQQEIVGTAGSPGTTFDRVQKVYFTPSGNYVIAFRQHKIFRRATNSTTWEEITFSSNPLTSISSDIYSYQWRDLAFVPGDANADNHFFIASANCNGAGSIAQVFEVTKSGSTWNINQVTTGTSFTNMGLNPCLRIEMSVPDNQYLFAVFLDFNNVPQQAALARYNLGTQQWDLINGDLDQSLKNLDGHSIDQQMGEFVVSPLKVPAVSGGPAINYNMYFGGLNIYQSYDGGGTYKVVGNYWGPNTHADIRAIALHTPTQSLHGANDLVFFGTDGGVAMKDRDVTIHGTNTCTDISGRGLSCATFWNVATSEAGGLITAGAQHQGVFSYEPRQSMKWFVESYGDGATTVFDEADKTKSWGTGWTTAVYYESHPTSARTIGHWTNAGSLPGDPEHNIFAVPLWTDRANHQFHAQRKLYKKSGSGWNSLSASLGLPEISHIRSVSFSPYDTTAPVGYVVFEKSDVPAETTASRKLYYRNSAPGALFQAKNLPNTGPQVTDVTCDPKNTARVWISMGGIRTGAPGTTTEKVYYSSDGGGNWADVSAGLPYHVPVTSIIFQEGSNNVYCATDVGIFKCDFTDYNAAATVNGINTSVQWTCFNKPKISTDPDFPCVYVTDLAINYCSGQLLASTYGRSMWATDILNGANAPIAAETISENTAWNTSKHLTGNIRITTGNTLTIQKSGGNMPVIHMPKNARIIVEPGATLIVDSAKITNACEDCQWGGIQVLGNFNSPQSSNFQGQAFLTNAIIEHAITGISNWNGSTSHTTSGGIIKATDTRFLNNSTSVHLFEYQALVGVPLKNYKANFVKCTFSIDNAFKGGTANEFNNHVLLFKVDGVSFKGCSFFNHNQSAKYKGWGSGIKSQSAGFAVREYCPGLGCTTGTPNKFRGLVYGVYADAGETVYPIDIDRTHFDSCTFGIRLVQQKLARITRDSFRIGRGKEGSFSAADCKKNVGIFATGECWPVIEENTFQGYTHAGQSPGFENLGLIMQNTGEADKTVYLNSFKGLGRACLAINSNSNGAKAGLRFQCNTYQGNGKDIHVNAQPRQGIATFQGDNNRPAGNLFLTPYPSGTHIDNNGRYINYFYNSSVANSKPMNPSLYGVVNVTTSAACTSRYDVGMRVPLTDVGPIKLKASQLKSSRNTLLSDYTALVDDGDTPYLLNTIAGMVPEDSAYLRTKLQSISPYVSDTVMRSVAFSNILAKPVLQNVLSGNPELLRDETLLDYLQFNIPNPFNPGEIEQLRIAAQNVTSRTTLEANISSLTGQMAEYAHILLSDMLLDTMAVPADSVIRWMDYTERLTDEYSKAAYYAARGDYIKGENVLNNIPTKFDLSQEETDEYTSYQDLWNILKGIRQDQRTILEIHPGELDAVTVIHDNAPPLSRIIRLAGSIIQAPLFPKTTIACDITLVTGHLKQESGLSERHIPGVRQNMAAGSNVFRVYPNPASDVVTIDYRINNATGPVMLTITNITGQTVKKTTLPERSGQLTWETKETAPGVYLYKFMDQRASLATGNIVIIK